MDVIHIEKELVGKLSAAGILAYLAVSIADGTEATTAALAGLVKAQTVRMLDGLKELSVVAPERVCRKENKWRCGVVKAGDGVVVQTLDSERYRLLVDDLKTYWDYLNPTLSFEMQGRDGIQIRKFLSDHREWGRGEWGQALRHRIISVVHYGHASRTQPLWAWVGRLDDYHAGPLNEFNRPAEGGGKIGKTIGIEDANRQARATVLSKVRG